MKKEDLFDALGDINNQYIKEAHVKKMRKNNFAWVKWGTIAACFTLFVLCINYMNCMLKSISHKSSLSLSTPDCLATKI